MYLSDFPDITWLKSKIKNGFADKKGWEGKKLSDAGWPNVILNAQTKYVLRNDIKGPLSLFLNLKGKSTITVDKQTKTIDEDSFYISNQDQVYSLAIDEPSTVETFNIHFGEFFANNVAVSLQKSNEFLLEEQSIPTSPINFFNARYFRGPQFNSLIKKIKSSKRDNCMNELLEEQLLFELFGCIYLSDRNNRKNFVNLPGIKSTTYQEISKRLMNAADFIHAHFKLNISLDQISQVACLSKFHFLRLFKIGFGCSPHQYIVRLRVCKGIDALKTTNKTIEEIASEVGLENGNSFSRMIHRKTGNSPTFYRK